MLGLADGLVRLVEHDRSWSAAYAAVRDQMRSVLAGVTCQLEHVGSTAILGLPAKPIIDIAIGVASDEEGESVERLCAAGYEYRGFKGASGHVFVVRHGGLRTHHLHVVPIDSDQWFAYLRFRDLLRVDPSAREQYAQVKRELSARFSNDRLAYVDGKNQIVSSLLAGKADGSSA